MISLMTSTGFATTDYSLWGGALARDLHSGRDRRKFWIHRRGLKVVRIILLKKFISTAIYKTVHPRAIFSIKLDGRTLTEVCSLGDGRRPMLLSTMVVVSAALILMGTRPPGHNCTISSISTGPAIGELGPLGTYGSMPDLAKIVLIFGMWAGRLEFLTVFALMTPVFWRELLRYRRTADVRHHHQK